jgi:arsenate reductase
MEKSKKQKVIFLCTQNSARSQMAEGFLRHYGDDRFEAYSAGTEPTGEIHPYAVEVMKEVGIDISDQYPKRLKTYLGKMGFNYLIIVCARAEKNCPKTFPGVHARISWLFDDPRGEEVREEDMLESFREIRDEIERKILIWIENPEAELAKLREERERQRRKRVETEQREAEHRAGQGFGDEVLSAGLDLDPGEFGYTPSPRRRPCAL